MSKNKKEEKPLKILVKEKIKTTEKPPGSPLANFDLGDDKLPQEEKEKRQKIMIEYTRLMGLYCEPHNKKSKWIKEENISRIVRDGKDLVAMCNLPRGKYNGITALAHSQIDSDNPLRFFVLSKGMVIINPIIFKHTKTPILKNEGCMSYPEEPIKHSVPRYSKITVIYQTLEKINNNEEELKLTKPIIETLNGGIGHVFQHEISHCNGANIYDKNFKPESCVGFGDGSMTESEAKKLFESN